MDIPPSPQEPDGFAFYLFTIFMVFTATVFVFDFITR